MQDCCKWEKELFLICKSLANAKTFFFRLQDSCKRKKVLFPICKTLASAANYFFRFARLLQAFSKSSFAVAARYPRHPLWIRSPIPSSNSRYGKEDHARGWDLHRSEGWCGIDAVALAAAEAVIANFRPWIIYYHHAAIPRRIWANFWQHIC